MIRARFVLGHAVAVTLLMGFSTSQTMGQPMVEGEKGWKANEILTIGETITGITGALNPNTVGNYTPVGILDGLGAYELDEDTVRVFANHELPNNRGHEYKVSNGASGTFMMPGARVSFFDIDKETRQIVDAGIAYNTIYDANGNIASDPGFLANNLAGFSRFCSSGLFEAHQFGRDRGLENRIYFKAKPN